jgi:hypothetical protein
LEDRLFATNVACTQVGVGKDSRGSWEDRDTEEDWVERISKMREESPVGGMFSYSMVPSPRVSDTLSEGEMMISLEEEREASQEEGEENERMVLEEEDHGENMKESSWWVEVCREAESKASAADEAEEDRDSAKEAEAESKEAEAKGREGLEWCTLSVAMEQAQAKVRMEVKGQAKIETQAEAGKEDQIEEVTVDAEKEVNAAEEAEADKED